MGIYFNRYKYIPGAPILDGATPFTIKLESIKNYNVKILKMGI